LALRIESPAGEAELREFIGLQDSVNSKLPARWPALEAVEMPTLTGHSAVTAGKALRPFLAREGADVVARALAFFDPAYARRWGEPLGHLAMFEAMPGARGAVRAMVDAACEWLRAQGAYAVRAGFFMPLDGPFVIDAYHTLPPFMVRQNPEYYHSMLKDAGFASEKGMVDYRIEVTPELVVRYRSALESARRLGFDIVPLRGIPAQQRVTDFAPAFNEAFHDHWGYVAMPEAAFAEFFELFELVGGLDTSVIAYRSGEVVGTLMCAPEQTTLAVLHQGGRLKDAEKLNFLGIGVRETARGRGVNMAMASYAYLKMIESGARFLSYTLVVDDNWPSRRTAEKLGAKVSANYVVYRRDFSQHAP
jgi:GNAT superfamily N-acetyltransferase